MSAEQQVIYYTQTVCYTRMKDNSCLDQYYDARYYKNDQSFTIEPNEDILLVIRNCGNHWFRHALSYETRLRENKTSFRITSHVPFQQCLWIKNISSTKGFYVEEHTTLSAILSEPEILFKLCHVSVHDLQNYAQHQTTTELHQEIKKEEESEEMSSAAEEEEEEDSDTTTTTTTQSSGSSQEKKKTFVIIDH